MVGSFSFDTPEAVMQVLSAIRASDLSAADKEQLRDLVFSYTSGGKDPAVQVQLEQQLEQFGVTPIAAPAAPDAAEAATPPADTAAAAPATPHQFGSARAVPRFTPPAPPTEAAPIEPSEPAPSATPAPAPQAPEATAVAEAPKPESSSQPEPEPEPAPAPAGTTDPLARIKEIKAAVNEQVGNPVHLVDLDNNVGREYMAALLAALKQANGGGDAAAALERLEASYQAVLTVLKNKPAPSEAPAEPAAAPAPADVNASAPEQPAPAPAPTPAPTVAPETAEPSVPAEPLKSAPPEPPESSASTAPASAPIKPESAPQPAAPAPAAEKDATPAPAVPSATPAAPTTAAAPTPRLQVSPLSKTGEPLKSVTDLPTADDIKTATKAGDPLFTAEVTDGLNQLLGDWPLFKKSGLFGSGPKGTEHPLYVKVKDLEIPVLLAGRFPGATQDIKQSITDYMNGWRYEQGIIYEAGETFDHYLRRVIRHILDLQK